MSTALIAVVVAVVIGLGIWVWRNGVLSRVTATPATRSQLWKALTLTAYLIAVAGLTACAVQCADKAWIPWAASGAALTGLLIWVWLEEGWPQLTIDPAARMQLWKAILLVAYLVTFMVGTSYAVYGLWEAEPQQPMQVPPNEPDCTHDPAPTPVIKALDPSKLFIGTDHTDILVLGCNFVDKDKVRFNREDDRMATLRDAQHLLVSLSTADFRAPGTMTVKVWRAPGGEKDVSKEVLLRIDAAAQQTAHWRFLRCSVTINQELRLLLLVLFTGTLGACIYALKSLADYIGTVKLNESWFTFYFVQPFEGAGIAILFYMLIRGGFLAGTNADVKAVNPFGICAIAALVGVFSDLAFAKLREIFMTLFKPVDDRGGKIGPSITTKSPLPDATQGVAYNQALQAANGKPPYVWDVPALPPGLQLDKASGTLTGTPTAVTPKARYVFKVTDSSGASGTADLELEVN